MIYSFNDSFIPTILYSSTNTFTEHSITHLLTHSPNNHILVYSYAFAHSIDQYFLIYLLSHPHVRMNVLRTLFPSPKSRENEPDIRRDPDNVHLEIVF